MTVFIVLAVVALIFLVEWLWWRRKPRPRPDEYTGIIHWHPRKEDE